MKSIPPDPEVVKNAQTALEILKICAKAAGNIVSITASPVVWFQKGSEMPRRLEPGEVVEFDPEK